MSTAGAISAVTELLREILNDNISSTKSVEIHTTSPDKITNIGAENYIINLYLYRITYNQGWNNHNYPSRDSAGQRIGSPALALNLHYMLTTFGSGVKDESEEQKLIGRAMQVFHEMPVIPRALIEKSTNATLSGLADQTENIRITPEPLTTEESFRIWSSLQTNYRLSVGYQVTVVLIESTKSVRTALPVSGTTLPDHSGRQIRVVPYRQPTVDSISNSAGDGVPITATDDSCLLIRGRNLIAEDVRVMSGSNVIKVDTISDNMIKISSLPESLTAGVLPLQVIHLVKGRIDNASSVKPFVLHPVISPPTVSNVTGSTTKQGKIEINVNPKIEKRQQVKLFLNKIKLEIGEEALGYTLYPPADNGITGSASSTGSVVFDFKNIVAGTYLVRVQVDGAESPLKFNTDDGYYKPMVVI